MDDRIEWAHRWADPSLRDLDDYGPDGIIAFCRDRLPSIEMPDGTFRVNYGPCGAATTNGRPIEHIWRRVVATEWQVEGFVEPETIAGAPENLRALSRLLAPYASCTGHRENCGPNCLGGGLCQVLAMAFVNVGAELEKTDG